MKLQKLTMTAPGRGMVRVEAVAPPLPTRSHRAGAAPAGPSASAVMDYAKPEAWSRPRLQEQAPRWQGAPRPTDKGAQRDGFKQPHGQLPRETSISQQTDLSVTWLGTSSGAPTGFRNVSCTVVQMPGAIFLVDCGEGSHRQLQQANIDLSKVEGVLITHLHGDHCFGLATALQLIDNAKSQSAKASVSNGAGSAEPAPLTRVFGPPGLIELLRVSMALTGEEHRLHTSISVTELVLDAPALQPSGLAGHRPEAVSGTRLHERGGRSVEEEGADSWEVSAAWDMERTCSWSGAAGSKAGQPKISAHRLGSLSVFDSPSLRRAAAAVQQGVRSQPSIWAPGRRLQQAAADSQVRQQQLHAQGSGSDSDDPEYHGRGYIASFGRFWELPCKHARVRAAQLQHRVPCWGYVFEEMLAPDGHEQAQQQLQQQTGAAAPSSEPGDYEGMRVGRKVVILGDTISSAPIAPLALNCDIISHEATFMAGMEAKCRHAQHSTAYLAGAFANFVKAKHLVLTHFSGRYSPTRPPVGKPGQERQASDEEDREEQSQAIECLIREARRYYGNGTISAAHDFFMINVQRQLLGQHGP